MTQTDRPVRSGGGPAAAGLGKERWIEGGPREDAPLSADARPHHEEELLLALKELGVDGDLSALELPASGEGALREALEADPPKDDDKKSE